MYKLRRSKDKRKVPDMTLPNHSSDEAARLETLGSYEILDTPREACFDRVTSLAAKHFNVPICLISLIDEDRQWCKSKFGIEIDEVGREVAFCSHTIKDSDVLVVRDTTADERF